MKTAISIILILNAVLLSNCAHTNREKIVENIIISSAVGAAIGFAQPKHKEVYATMYAGVAGAAAGIATALVYDFDANSRQYKVERDRFTIEVN